MPTKRFEMVVKKGDDFYTVELTQPACVDDDDSPENICKAIVENALKTKGFQKLIKDMTVDTDEALFAAIGYIYRSIVLPLLTENENYNTIFYSEYKTMARKKKDEEIKKRFDMLTYFMEHS